jgi:DNA-binding beta-propeller fold protein YncE
MSRSLSRARLATIVSTAVCSSLVLCLWFSAIARGAAFGELAQGGGFGSGSGQFSYPSDVAVDSTDNSVFVLDEPGAEQRGVGPESFRIQKFEAANLKTPVASVSVLAPAINFESQVVEGIAVDSEHDRLYVLKAIEIERGIHEPYAAEEVVVYSTETLKEIEVFYKFAPVPSSGALPAESVLEPHGIAVDPKTHALLLLGSEPENGENSVIQQITSTGATGERFEDSSHEVARQGSGGITGIAVGPEGKIYASTQTADHAGSGSGVLSLSIESPNSLKAPVVQNVVTEESAKAGEPDFLTGGNLAYGREDFGAQVAVAPEGGTIYAMQMTEEQESGSLTKEGNYQIRGVNEHGIRQVVLGGGPGGLSPKCRIASVANAFAAGKDGVVFALDEGARAEKEGKRVPSEYGFRLIEFGPDGSSCPTPAAVFRIDHKEPTSSPVKAIKGKTVVVEALAAGLNGEEPEEVSWDVEGPGGYKYETASKSSQGKPASLETSLPLLKPGQYTIGLKIVLKGNGNFGNPPPATGTLTVEAEPPQANFEVFLGEALLAGREVKPGEAVTFNGSGSIDPNGGPNGEATTELKSYEWSFGDGKTETTSANQYTRSFVNSTSEAREEQVSLTVVNAEGVQSQPAVETIKIQGTTVVKTPIIEAPKEVIPPPSKPVTPPPPVKPVQKKPLTRLQKLDRALKLCKKDHSRKARMTCERAAYRLYGPKPKKKKR